MGDRLIAFLDVQLDKVERLTVKELTHKKHRKCEILAQNEADVGTNHCVF